MAPLDSTQCSWGDPARQVHLGIKKRKGLSFAHLVRSRVVAAQITRLSYNWVRVHSSLRVPLLIPVDKRKYDQRTPAMAIGITTRVWDWLDLLTQPVWAMAMRDYST